MFIAWFMLPIEALNDLGMGREKTFGLESLYNIKNVDVIFFSLFFFCIPFIEILVISWKCLYVFYFF